MTAHLARFSYLGLLAWQWAWHFALPTGHQSWLLAGVLSLPLLVPLPGIMRGEARARTWGAYLLLLYLMGSIMEAWSSPVHRLAALVQLIICLAYLGVALVAGRRVSGGTN